MDDVKENLGMRKPTSRFAEGKTRSVNLRRAWVCGNDKGVREREKTVGIWMGNGF